MTDIIPTHAKPKEQLHLRFNQFEIVASGRFAIVVLAATMLAAILLQ